MKMNLNNSRVPIGGRKWHLWPQFRYSSSSSCSYDICSDGAPSRYARLHVNATATDFRMATVFI